MKKRKKKIDWLKFAQECARPAKKEKILDCPTPRSVMIAQSVGIQKSCPKD